MNMIVSGISEKNGEKIAYILFEENRLGKKLSAEGNIPACKIMKNEGFTEDEVSQLEKYMQDNLAMLKKQAASVNPIKALIQ